MHLMAEAGATKIDWVLMDKSQQIRFTTSGFNPNTADANYLRQLLVTGFPAECDPQTISDVTYFGAGCGNQQGYERVITALKGFFTLVHEVTVLTDLEAAAKAYLGKNSGIIGILGTGSNAGYFEDGKLIEAPFSTGFLLGDEGSGAHFGKLFASAYLRGYLPDWMSDKFEKQYEVTRTSLFTNVYNNSMINRYLAQFVPFIVAHKNETVISEMVFCALKEYKKHYVKPLYCKYKNPSVTITGGIASSLSEELCMIFDQGGIYHVKTGNNTFELLLNQLK